jgi:large subunit ribosomal protein L15
MTGEFAGKRIIQLQTSQALINSSTQPSPIDQPSRGHPALNGLAGLTTDAEDKVLDKKRLAGIAERYGLDKVTRWKPKRVRVAAPFIHSIIPLHCVGNFQANIHNTQADNLQSSGQDAVLVTSLYAIVGAIALERGGEIANKVTQDKILAPLGFNFSTTTD